MNQLPQELPEELRLRAFVAGPGDYAWDREDSIAVAITLADVGIAVTGGEVWAVEEDGTIWGDVPQLAGPGATASWSVQPVWNPKTESWDQFCHRAAEYCVSMIESITVGVGSNAVPRFRERIRFQLDLTSREEEEGIRL
jgi:hypothetical protein